MSSIPAKKIGMIKRHRVSMSSTQMVKTGYLHEGQYLPLLIEPLLDELDLFAWVEENKGQLEHDLLRHGGILFRGFSINPEKDFQHFLSVLSQDILSYQDRGTPRSEVGNGIYTSTDYPASQTIELHNENSYAYSWPSKIAFCCLTPAATGGETPIADSRKIYQRIPQEVRERFIDKGVMYVRNFGDRFGPTWQSAFQTDNIQELETFCEHSHIQLEWKDEQHLRSQQIRPATIRHPLTKETCWFNQANAFHFSTLEQAVQEALFAERTERDLPKNALFGDGTPIARTDLEAIREAFRQETIFFSWQRGDILLLDNMLVAHGRAPFIGTRKVVVSMADACNWEHVSHA